VFHSKCGRLAILTLFLVLAGIIFRVAPASADGTYVMSYAYQSFSPGEGHGSVYDYQNPGGYCGSYYYNEIYKQFAATGGVTFIDGSGGWHGTVINSSTHTWSNIGLTYYWTYNKKGHCWNGDIYSYWAHCYVWLEIATCA
jgi:hypothetical protein